MCAASNHTIVEVAESKTKLRKLRQQLEEKTEQLAVYLFYHDLIVFCAASSHALVEVAESKTKLRQLMEEKQLAELLFYHSSIVCS